MGWSVLSKPPAEGWQAFIDRGFHPYKVIVSAIGSDGNYYAAIERPAGNGLPRCVYAVVGLIEGAGWKLMSDSECPYYYAAPYEVLAALEPTSDPGAVKWRGRVAAALAAGRDAELQAERIAEWRADDREAEQQGAST